MPALANAHGCANSVTPSSALQATVVAAVTLSGPAGALGSRGDAADVAPAGGCPPPPFAPPPAPAGAPGPGFGGAARPEAPAACSPERGSAPVPGRDERPADPNAPLGVALRAGAAGMPADTTVGADPDQDSGSVSCTLSSSPRPAMVSRSRRESERAASAGALQAPTRSMRTPSVGGRSPARPHTAWERTRTVAVWRCRYASGRSYVVVRRAIRRGRLSRRIVLLALGVRCGARVRWRRRGCSECTPWPLFRGA